MASKASFWGALHRLQAHKDAKLPIEEQLESEQGKPAASLYHTKNHRRSKDGNEEPNTLELAEISRTTRLYRTNLFGMQIERFLKEVSVDYMKLGPLEQFIKLVKSKLDSLHEHHIDRDLQRCYPFMRFTGLHLQNSYDWSFTFRRPSRCDLVGSYLLRTVTWPCLNIDICAEMPSDMFSPKDYLNYRYFNKRAAYVAEMFLQLRRLFPYCREEECGHSIECHADAVVLKNDASPFRPYFYLQSLSGDARQPIIAIKCLIARKGHEDDTNPTDRTHKCTRWTLRIFAVPPPGIFCEAKLAPHKNAVRFCSTSKLPGVLVHCADESSNRLIALPPTPLYNGALLEDMRWLQRLNSGIAAYPGLRQAVQLLKAWSYTKGLAWTFPAVDGSASQTFVAPISGFTLSLVALHVCMSASGNSMNKASPIQIFTMTLSLLANLSRTKKIVFGEKMNDVLTETERHMGLFFFVDPSSKSSAYNVFWQCQHVLPELKNHARAALRAMESLSNPFDLIFERHSSPVFDFDMTLFIPPVNNIESIPGEGALARSDNDDVARLAWIEAKTTSQGLACPPVLLDIPLENPPHVNMAGYVIRLILRGLHDRLEPSNSYAVRYSLPPSTVIYPKGHAMSPPPFSWTDMHPLSSSLVPMPSTFIGIKLASMDAESSASRKLFSLVNRGVPADSPAAQAFRHFWGNSAVRRYQDGSINESVVWDPPTPLFVNLGVLQGQSDDDTADIPAVPAQILQHLVQRHLPNFRLQTKCCLLRADTAAELPSIVINCGSLGLLTKPILTYIAADGSPCPHPVASFAELRSLMIGLKDLSLDVKDFQSAELKSGCLRYGDPGYYCPLPLDYPCPGEQLIHCVIEFAKSGGWPSEPAAIKKIKAALLLDVRSKLRDMHGVESHIGGACVLPDGSVTEPYLDIFYPPDPPSASVPRCVFRVQVFYVFEHLRTASALTDPTTDVIQLRKDVPILPAVIKDIRRLWWSPLVESMFHSAHLAFPALSPTLRLLRLWASSHGFPLDRVSEVLEHVCLETFRRRMLEGPPSSPHSGFLQTLTVLTAHDWDNEGFFLAYDLQNPGLSSSENESLKGAWRRLYDSLVMKTTKEVSLRFAEGPRVPFMWIGTPLDPHCQLIQTPDRLLALALLEKAREVVKKVNSFFFGVVASPPVFSCGSTTYRNPSLHHLSSDWLTLFGPQSASEYDLVIYFRAENVRDGAAEWRSAYRKQLGALTVETPEKGFKNLRRFTKDPSLPLTEPTSLPATTTDAKDAALMVYRAMTVADKKYSDGHYSGQGHPFALALMKCVPYLETVHAANAVLVDAFQNYIAKLRTLFGTTAEIFYDSLAVPYPRYVYLKFDLERCSLHFATPSHDGRYPKCYISSSSFSESLCSTSPCPLAASSRDFGDSEAVASPIFQLPNIPLLVALLMTEGAGLVEDVEVL